MAVARKGKCLAVSRGTKGSNCLDAMGNRNKMIKFGKATRRYTADILTKIAEYLLSIIILGSIISGHFYLKLVIGSFSFFLVFVLLAIILVASTEEEGEK